MEMSEEMALEKVKAELLRAWSVKAVISRCLETCTHNVVAARKLLYLHNI